MSRYDRGPGYGRDRANRDDRGFFDRAGDEVRSWFGDDEAERRRDRDERYDDRREHYDEGRRYGPREAYDVHTRRGDFEGRSGYDDRDTQARNRRYADPDSRTGEYRSVSSDDTGRRSYGTGDRRDTGRDTGRDDRYRRDREDRDSPREEYLEDRYDRDYNRQYARDYGDHRGMQGRFESGGSERGGYRSDERYDYGDRSRGNAGDKYSRGREGAGRGDSDYGRGTGTRGTFGSSPRNAHRSESGVSRGTYASRGGYGGGRSDRYY